MATNGTPEYNNVRAKLKTYSPPLLAPGHSYNIALTTQIAALKFHPTIESALPSAHFLVRHMQCSPKVEGMLLHGILHRIEGDYDNARAWYSDVASDDTGHELLGKIWEGGEEGMFSFLDQVEMLNKGKRGNNVKLGETSRQEFIDVLKCCEEKFGTEKWEDASNAWKQPSEKIKKMVKEMTTGDERFRKF